MKPNNNSGEDRIKKVLFNEVSLALAVASMVFWLMNYINSPITEIQLQVALIQRDISVIKEEHLKYTANANDRDKAIIEMGKQITRILTLLERK